MANCGVYQITNTITGDYYIGSTCNIKHRIVNHRRELSKDTHRNSHLQRAWNKYGADSFEFTTILLCDIENKLYYEQVLLDGLKPTYNIATNATASMQGLRFSEEHRRKIGEAHKGNTNRLGQRTSAETRAKISKANTGKQFSEEHKRNISEAKIGKPSGRLGMPMSEEQKRKLSVANTGKHPSEEARTKMSERMKGNTRLLGKHHTEETKRKIGAAQTGELNCNFGKPRSEETKRKISEALKRRTADANMQSQFGAA